MALEMARRSLTLKTNEKSMAMRGV